MEFLTGVKEKETTSVSEILSGDYVGKTVKMNGAVHNIRDMGEFAFVILRKAEGLVQCVYEEGKTEFDLKNLKEESAVEVTGVVELEERAPQDFELRLTGIRVRNNCKGTSFFNFIYSAHFSLLVFYAPIR